MPGFFRDSWSDLRALLAAFGRGVVCRRMPCLLFLLASLVLILAAHRFDGAVLHGMTDERGDAPLAAAKALGYWGDFYRVPLAIALGMWAVGAIRNRARWRTIGLACVLAGMLAGIACNIVRSTTGRPRPRAEIADGFYWFKFKHKYNSFPSAHTTTCFAMASAVATAAPAVGVPLLAGAGTVAWSRMYLKNHYFSDVTAGILLGCFFGVGIGLAARRRIRAGTGP